MKNALKDSSNRIITYLRISITDNCNFRCAYCSPNGLVDKITNGAILSAGETVRLAGIFASLGVKKVRLTGGEPLLRRELSEIIRGIKGFPEIGDISITTNGVLLGRLSAELKEAGLNRINMSVPSLNAARYREITG
ncbi:MAG: radical SAM protein, partial [Deltaproteobacteria bacterium]|nr:radical SAM protein [Deltaproteobacteria bacterium]